MCRVSRVDWTEGDCTRLTFFKRWSAKAFNKPGQIVRPLRWIPSEAEWFDLFNLLWRARASADTARHVAECSHTWFFSDLEKKDIVRLFFCFIRGAVMDTYEETQKNITQRVSRIAVCHQYETHFVPWAFSHSSEEAREWKESNIDAGDRFSVVNDWTQALGWSQVIRSWIKTARICSYSNNETSNEEASSLWAKIVGNRTVLHCNELWTEVLKENEMRTADVIATVKMKNLLE